MSFVLLLACGDDGNTSSDGGGAGAGSTPTSDEASAVLEAVGGSGVTGEATFSIAYDGDLVVNIDIEGCEPAANHDVYVGDGTSCDSLESIGRNFGSVATSIYCGDDGSGLQIDTNSAKMDEATIGGDSSTNIIGHVIAVWAYNARETDPPLTCGVIVAD